ncbi:hypothetical protein H8356DRAFT_1281107 [Neocallimastix lanati (nom. inval.)]|nr:hypothetical protein H8356DRAFT_1281107 [Neocallimastix sp. JGI-2020a]
MNIKYLSIISSTYISLINCAVHFERIYGVADEDLGKYQKTPDNLFHCLDGNGVIPYSSLNDDYCDCADGSDEPGTPACPNSKFYCENHGSKGNFIPSSRVNDGVCDYELCCDGSDEYNGIIICPDRCEEMARIEEREKTKKILNYVMSFQKYQKMLVNSLANITLDSTTFLEKKAMHLAENEKLDKLKDKIKHLEEIEKESKDFYKSLFRELRSEYRVTRARLIESVKDIMKLKNYKNMDQVEIDNILNNYDEIYLKEIVPEGTEIKEYENENELIKEEEEEENRLVQEKRDIYNSIRSELTTLRVERNDLDRTVRGYKREAEELEKKLNMDSGKNDIFYSIYGETFTLNTTDYIYTFIWGKEIKQKQRKGGNLTLLG